MSILSFISNAIDTVTTSIKEFVAPKEVSKTNETKTTKETVPMVSAEVQNTQKNEDTVEINTKSVESVYKQIEEICEEYKMSMEDVKKAKMLEGILGCSTEELTKKSDEEINKAIEALQFVLSWQSWVLPFQSRDMEDIIDITQKANAKYIALETGRGCWADIFRFSSSLEDKLKDAGYNEVTKENVENYFKDLIRDAVATGDREKIEEAYTEAFKTFGDLLNDTEDPEQKAILTTAITQLQASHRQLAASLSIASCGNNETAKFGVSKGIAKNYRAMACTTDALGNRTSTEDNLKISQTAFQNMSEEDSIEVLNETMEYNRELTAKLEKGEELTPEEEYYLNNAINPYYAGAMIGACCNTSTNYSPQSVLSTIDQHTEEMGIQSVVYNMANDYVSSHEDSLPITTSSFTQTVNSATGGNYTTVLATTDNNESPGAYTLSSATTYQTQNKNKASSIYNNSTNPIQQTQYSTTTINTGINPVVQQQNNNENIVGTEVSANTSSSVANRQTESNNSNTNTNSRNGTVTNPIDSGGNTPPTKSNSAYNAQTYDKNTIERQKAIQSGVGALRQYAKDNDVNILDLAIDTLNSSNASSATKKWALEQYQAASNSEQILNFNKITHSESAVAIARNMDKSTRSQLSSFRSFYIKEAIENLDETVIT